MASRAERRAARSGNSNPPAAIGGSEELEGGEHTLDPEQANADIAEESPIADGEAPTTPSPSTIDLDERQQIERAARRAALLEAADYAERDWGSVGLMVAGGLRKRAGALA